ncbi:MAG: hypothetical protein ACFFA3_17945 [Promethearchaeota archaeon]
MIYKTQAIIGIVVILLGYWCASLAETLSDVGNCFIATLFWAIPMICIGFGCIFRKRSDK